MPEAGTSTLAGLAGLAAIGTLVAQAPGGRSSSTDVLLWVGVLIVVTLAGAMVILAIRRRTLAGPRTPDAGTLMDQLREMRDRGQMTQAEFDAAIAAMKARLRAQIAPPGQVSGQGQSPAPGQSPPRPALPGATPTRPPDNPRSTPAK
jgi:hypothetical protein